MARAVTHDCAAAMASARRRSPGTYTKPSNRPAPNKAPTPGEHTYRARAGIEGTIHQTVALTGVRRACYTGSAKVELEHAFAATAINLVRIRASATPDPSPRCLNRSPNPTGSSA
jgi:IS5 family transposase